MATVEEIRGLIRNQRNPAKTLDAIVRTLRLRFRSDVCSVYLLRPHGTELVLAATIGLNADSVGKVRMRLDEGLVGLTAQAGKPVVVEDAPHHLRFKYFPEAGEDHYHSFLGVPLLDQGMLQGVLVVQTMEPRAFTSEEVQLLVDATIPLGSIVREVRALQ